MSLNGCDIASYQWDVVPAKLPGSSLAYTTTSKVQERLRKRRFLLRLSVTGLGNVFWALITKASPTSSSTSRPK